MNFRDEKTVLGVGEVQVRTRTAVETVPSLIVTAYAFLLLAYADVEQGRIGLPVPKWHRVAPSKKGLHAPIDRCASIPIAGKSPGCEFNPLRQQQGGQDERR